MYSKFNAKREKTREWGGTAARSLKWLIMMEIPERRIGRAGLIFGRPAMDGAPRSYRMSSLQAAIGRSG